jgi:hypothetical protein
MKKRTKQPSAYETNDLFCGTPCDTLRTVRLTLLHYSNIVWKAVTHFTNRAFEVNLSSHATEGNNRSFLYFRYCSRFQYPLYSSLVQKYSKTS